MMMNEYVQSKFCFLRLCLFLFLYICFFFFLYFRKWLLSFLRLNYSLLFVFCKGFGFMNICSLIENFFQISKGPLREISFIF